MAEKEMQMIEYVYLCWINRRTGETGRSEKPLLREIAERQIRMGNVNKIYWLEAA